MIAPGGQVSRGSHGASGELAIAALTGSEGLVPDLLGPPAPPPPSLLLWFPGASPGTPKIPHAPGSGPPESLYADPSSPGGFVVADSGHTTVRG